MKDEIGDQGPLGRYAEGLMLRYEGKYEEALAAYNEAIEGKADHPLVYCARSRVLEALDRKAEEQNDLMYAHTRQPWRADVRAELASNAFEQSDFAKAIQLADLDTADRECAFAYDISGRANLAQLDRLALKSLMKQNAFSAALSRVESDPEPMSDARLLFRRAMVYVANGNIPRAAEELSAAIETHETAVSEADEEDAARIKEITEQIPQNFAAALTYSLSPAYQRDPKEALGRLEKMTSRFPENARIWLYIARVSSLLKDREYSKEACKRALSLDRSCVDAMLLLCMLLHGEENLQGLLDLANEVYPKALPLGFACGLAQSLGQIEQATDIAYEILNGEIHPMQEEAIRHILVTVNSESPKYLQVLERLPALDLFDLSPFDFELLSYTALLFLTNGMFTECLKYCNDLLSNEMDYIPAILFYGLSHIALDANSYENTQQTE